MFSPTVEEGERELELKAGLAKLKDGTRVRAESLGIGYGVTRWWSAEIAANWHKEPGEQHGFDAWEFENRFQLTQPGRFPVDVGFLLEIERPIVDATLVMLPHARRLGGQWCDGDARSHATA